MSHPRAGPAPAAGRVPVWTKAVPAPIFGVLEGLATQLVEGLAALPGGGDTAEGLGSWDEANPEPHATLSDVADHIDHIREMAGIDHIGIGADFDGITSVPIGLEDVSAYPSLPAELIRREYDDEDILKILGGNVLRVMRLVENRSRELQETRGASEALIDDVDGE